MTEIEEVISFSREYINSPNARTAERRQKIRNVYQSITGQYVKASCGTCYIEAIFKIIKYNPNKMPSKYKLKQGVLLQAFSDESKVMTNDTLDRLPQAEADALAEWHLANTPDCRRFFAVIPGDGVKPVVAHPVPGMTIIVPAEVKQAVIPEVIQPKKAQYQKKHKR